MQAISRAEFEKRKKETIHKKPHGGHAYVSKADDGVYQQMNEQERISAQFMAASYDDVEKRKDVGGFKYDRSISTDNFASYHNPTSGDTYAAFRGTATVKGALKTWLPIGVGALSKTGRFKENRERAQKHHAKHSRAGGKNYLTGHSLGGSLSREIIKKDGSLYDHAYTFDEGTSVLSAPSWKAAYDCSSRNKGKKPDWCTKMTRMRAGSDAVSGSGSWAYGSKTFKTTKKKNPLKAHDKSIFLPKG